MTTASCAAVRIGAHVRGHAQYIRKWKNTVTIEPQLTTQTHGLSNAAMIYKNAVGQKLCVGNGTVVILDIEPRTILGNASTSRGVPTTERYSVQYNVQY